MSEKIEFETALSELENIVQKLEKGDTSLNESIELFERGIKFSKICNEYLGKAKLSIKTLNDSKGE